MIHYFFLNISQNLNLLKFHGLAYGVCHLFDTFLSIFCVPTKLKKMDHKIVICDPFLSVAKKPLNLSVEGDRIWANLSVESFFINLRNWNITNEGGAQELASAAQDKNMYLEFYCQRKI